MVGGAVGPRPHVWRSLARVVRGGAPSAIARDTAVAGRHRLEPAGGSLLQRAGLARPIPGPARRTAGGGVYDCEAVSGAGPARIRDRPGSGPRSAPLARP